MGCIHWQHEIRNHGRAGSRPTTLPVSQPIHLGKCAGPIGRAVGGAAQLAEPSVACPRDFPILTGCRLVNVVAAFDAVLGLHTAQGRRRMTTTRSPWRDSFSVGGAVRISSGSGWAAARHVGGERDAAAKPRSLAPASAGHIHLTSLSPEQPTSRVTILVTTRLVLHAGVVCRCRLGRPNSSMLQARRPAGTGRSGRSGGGDSSVGDSRLDVGCPLTYDQVALLEDLNDFHDDGPETRPCFASRFYFSG